MSLTTPFGSPSADFNAFALSPLRRYSVVVSDFDDVLYFSSSAFISATAASTWFISLSDRLSSSQMGSENLAMEPRRLSNSSELSILFVALSGLRFLSLSSGNIFCCMVRDRAAALLSTSSLGRAGRSLSSAVFFSSSLSDILVFLMFVRSRSAAPLPPSWREKPSYPRSSSPVLLAVLSGATDVLGAATAAAGNATDATATDDIRELKILFLILLSMLPHRSIS